jgi:hypothetical protein
MARAITFESKKPELDRLHRYLSRIERQLAKDTEELRASQKLRADELERQTGHAIRIHKNMTELGREWNPADFGFVWSIAEIEAISNRRMRLYLALNAPKMLRAA